MLLPSNCLTAMARALSLLVSRASLIPRTICKIIMKRVKFDTIECVALYSLLHVCLPTEGSQ